MDMTYSQYLELIDKERVRKSLFKIELLRKEDNSVYDTIENDIVNGSGNLTIALNQGSRRSLTLSIVNKDGKYNTFFNNMILGSRFRLYLGVESQEYGTIFFEEGIFIYTNPTLTSDLSSQTIEITAKDRWALFDGTVSGSLQGTYSFPIGTRVSAIIQSLSALDIVDGLITFNIDSRLSMKTIPYTIEKDAGDTVGSILEEVAYSINAQIYFDRFGVLIIKPYDYDFIKKSMHTFDKELDINYLTASNNILYSELYNAVYVVADNYQNDKVPIYAELLNDDASDPNSINNLGFIKYKQISDYTEGISTRELARERCRYELKIVMSKQSSVSISALSLYHIDVNDCITINDNIAGIIMGRYIIQNIDLPIGNEGTMTVSVSKATTWL